MDELKEKEIKNLINLEKIAPSANNENISSNPPSTTFEKTLPTFKYDNGKSLDENAADLTELAANNEALKDDKFINEVAETKKESIKQSAKQNQQIHQAKKEAEKVTALTEIDKAFYEQWKLILNWGGVKEPVKKGLAIFLLFLILPFYTAVTIGITLPIAILKTMFGVINGLLEEINKFGKVARSISFTMLILGTIALVAYVILLTLNKYNIIDIF